LPCLARSGISATARLIAWGWYPVGRGEIQAAVSGLGSATLGIPKPLTLLERGPLKALHGRAVAANLPAQIAQRMADRARALLERADAPVTVAAERVRAACPGAGIFLAAEYAHIRCGFSALGRVGKAAETVAEEAVAAFAAHHESGAAFDRHLSDQMIAPLALASGASVFTTECATEHLATNAWVVERFGLARVIIDADDAGRCRVTVRPTALS
jgi:RNA 3'-terminal phosphate cyclase (ATP)